jgi:hypothetical protein
MFQQNVHPRFHAHPIALFLDVIYPTVREIKDTAAHLSVPLTLKSKVSTYVARENFVFAI